MFSRFFLRWLTVNSFLTHNHIHIFVPCNNSTENIPIAEVIKGTPEFSTLSSLVEAAGIEDILSEDTLTLFAPTNAGFADLSEALVTSLLEDTELLQFVLFGHVVARDQILLSDLECQGGELSSLTMANDEQTSISCGVGLNNTIITFIAGESQMGVPPKVVGPDGKACNGIIQAIDGVIMSEIQTEPTDAPISPTPAPIAPTDGD